MILGLSQIKETNRAKGPTVISPQWQDLGCILDGINHIYKNNISGMAVILSEDTMQDGKKYLHVSCSFKDRLPTWDDLKEVKNIFIGDEKVAYQVLPRQSEYINLMPYCLHLWSPMEE